MSKLTNNQSRFNTSKLSKTNNCAKLNNKTINYQEISTLKKLLRSEVREAKGQDLVNTYIKLIEKQYETLIEKSLINNELIKAHKNSRLFQKALENSKNKLNKRKNLSKTKKDSTTNNTKSISINNKISTSKSSTNISPIKKPKKNEDQENNKQNEINQQSTYWKDYDFLKVPNLGIKIEKKNTRSNNLYHKNKQNNTKTKSEDNYIFSQNKQLENYYLYLLNRRQKIYENEDTDEERQQEKLELEIIRQILEKIYEDDEKLRKKLEDENLPEFYKRFIIQNEIKKDNIFSENFKLNYKESQSLKGPKLSDKSRLICKYILNYEPIYKRLDKIINLQKNNLEKIKTNLNNNKNNNKKNSGKKQNLKETKEWLKSMDNWNERKNQKIKEKKELIEKNDPNNKECIFKPYINNNAKIKKEDEGLLYSDRLYLEYFTLREKKKKMVEKEINNYTFHPSITTYRKFNKKNNNEEDNFFN